MSPNLSSASAIGCQTSTKRVRAVRVVRIAYTLTFSTDDKVFGLQRKA